MPDVAAVSGQEAALLQLSVAFAAGLGTAFTPCVYPLIPVTIAVFGGNQVSRCRSFLLSSAYVLGISATFTILGLAAARSGSIFGSQLGHPAIVAGLSALLVLLALFTLDALQLPALNRLQNWAGKIGGSGFRGVFLMGAVSGIVAAPCTGPVLIAILAVAAKTQSGVWGAVLLFTYSLGFGSLFLLLGAFSSMLNRLPRPGAWLQYVKFALATAILMVAVYIALPLLPLEPAEIRRHWFWVVFALILSAPLWIGAAFRFNRPELRITASAVLACCLYIGFMSPAASVELAVPKISNTGSANVAWIENSTEAFKAAAAEQKTLMMDLSADWCAACKELEAVTFSDPTVAAALRRMVTAKIDFTSPTDETERLAERYSILGLPCVLFLKADGSELENSRVTGFMTPKEFLMHLQTVLN